MAAKKKVTRAAGLTLAIALAGATTMSPVAHAQDGEPSTSPASTSPAASAATTTTTETTVAPVVSTNTTTEKTDKPAPNTTAAAKLGAGTAGAKYNIGGWTFTALASNPQDDKLYALSTKDNGKEAGHLLLIDAEQGTVKDLGLVTLAGEGNKVDGIDAAAFTSDGTLVLFDSAGEKIFTRNMGDITSVRNGVKLKEVQRTGSDPKQGNPIAWVSSPDDSDKLIAVARGNNKPYLWTLDVNSGAASAEPLTVASGVKGEVTDPGRIEYAYAGEDGTFVFADSDGEALTLKGKEITAISEKGKGDADANIVGVVGGTANKQLVTGVAKPTEPSTNTSVAKPTEPSTNASVTQVDPQENNQPATGEWLHAMTITVKTADGKYVEGAEFQVVGNDGKSVGSVVEDAYLGEGVYRVQVQLPNAPQQDKILKLEVTDAPVGYETRTASFRPGDTSVTITLPRDPAVSTTNLPNRILAGVKEAQPVVSSALKPIAAIAGLNAANPSGKTTRTSSATTTSYTATRMTGGISTGRSTRATTASVRSNSTAARVVSNQTATSAVVYSDNDDDYLADTGTPMRAVISLGVISLLIGAAYLALGRRREA